MQSYTLHSVDVHTHERRVHLLGSTTITVTFNGGPIPENAVSVADDDTLHIDANEASASITPPWELTTFDEPDYTDVSVTVVHGNDTAFIVGTARNVPSHTPVYLIDPDDDNHLYRVDYDLGPQSGAYFSDTDTPDSAQYYTITDTGTGVTKHITRDEYETLYMDRMRPVIAID